MKSNNNKEFGFPEDKDIPEEFIIKESIIQKEYLVNGELHYWDGPIQEVFSPVCRRNSEAISPRLIGSYPLLTEKESIEVLEAAVRSWDDGKGLWPTMSIEDRIKCIEEFTYQIVEKKKDVVNLLMWEIGKSYRDSEKEFDRTIIYIRETITALKELDRISSRFVFEQGIIGQIRRAPLGITLCMGPYNYPLNETFTTLIPALIMGNIIIFKPPKHGVLLHRPLLEAFRSCFPKGVVNTVYGEGQRVISPLMSSGNIDVLAFIGSSRVADILRKQHPRPHRLRCVLGLEAKNAAIILPDADLDSTVKECILGALSYNGQRCTALKILFVHSKIAERFIKQFVEAVDALNCGVPWDRDVDITPLPEANKIQYLTKLVEDAQFKGARIINKTGGKVFSTLFYPAVLYPVNSKMRVYYEEQFGPVIPILPFDDIDIPVRYVIESDYGQQVSLFGKNAPEIAELIDSLVNQVCRVNINSQCQRGPDTFPFTGRKDSAEGTLSISDALRVFSIQTLVAAKESETNKELITKIVRERKSVFLSTDFIL